MLQIFGPSRKCHDRNNCFAMPPAGFRRHDQFGACLLRHSCTFRIPFCPIWLLFEMKLPRSALRFGNTYHFELDPFWPFGPAPGTWTRWNFPKSSGCRFWTRPGVRDWASQKNAAAAWLPADKEAPGVPNGRCRLCIRFLSKNNSTPKPQPYLSRFHVDCPDRR